MTTSIGVINDRVPTAAKSRGPQRYSHFAFSVWESAYAFSQTAIYVGLGMTAIGSYTLMEISRGYAGPHELAGPGGVIVGLVLCVGGALTYRLARRRVRRSRFLKRR